MCVWPCRWLVTCSACAFPLLNCSWDRPQQPCKPKKDSADPVHFNWSFSAPLKYRWVWNTFLHIFSINFKFKVHQCLEWEVNQKILFSSVQNQVCGFFFSFVGLCCKSKSLSGLCMRSALQRTPNIPLSSHQPRPSHSEAGWGGQAARGHEKQKAEPPPPETQTEMSPLRAAPSLFILHLIQSI